MCDGAHAVCGRPLRFGRDHNRSWNVVIGGKKERAMKRIADHVELSSVEARGGKHGRHLLIMLIVSGLAAIGLMSAFWILNGAAALPPT